jgi:hypothetical protein
MQPVTFNLTATDNCQVARSHIISASANEGSAADWQITGDLTLNLRAERAGNATRIYTIILESIDVAGNSSTGTVRVTVPH